MSESEMLDNIKHAIETWNDQLAEESVKTALANHVSPEDILSKGLSKGMETISRRFDDGEIFLPQVLAASKAMDSAIKFINEKIWNDDGHYKGVIVMGTVEGDIHEIGKSVCIAMLRGARYKVVDLGSDVSPEEFYRAVKDNSADIMAGSSLMTTTLEAQKKTVNELKEQKCEVIKLFGGAPCTKEWVDSIGGDGYSASGYELTILADSIMKLKKKKTRTAKRSE